MGMHSYIWVCVKPVVHFYIWVCVKAVMGLRIQMATYTRKFVYISTQLQTGINSGVFRNQLRTESYVQVRVTEPNFRTVILHSQTLHFNSSF